MIIAWHFLFYSFYKFFLEVHYFFNKINPLVYLFKMKIFEDNLKKRDISVVEDTNKAFENRSYGFTIQICMFLFNILSMIVVFTLINLTLILFKTDYNVTTLDFIIIVLSASLINTYWFLRESSYTRSFSRFDGFSKSSKRLYFFF